MAKSTIIMKGFLCFAECPTEGLLTVGVDVTGVPRPKYLEFRDKFQDLLRRIDIVYAKRITRGRSLKVTYTRHKFTNGNGKLRTATRATAYFSPYPQRFSNILKADVRRALYGSPQTQGLLERYCIVLGKAEERRLFFLPANRAPMLFTDVSELNKKIEELNKRLIEFRKTKHFKTIVDYVAHARGAKIDPQNKLYPIRLVTRPLTLDPRLFEEYLGKKQQAASQEVDKRREAGLKLLEEELTRQRRELTEQVLQGFQDQLGGLVRRLRAYTGRQLKPEDVKALRATLKDINETAKDVGATVFLERLTKSALSLVDGVTKKDKEAVNAAAAELASELGISETKSDLKDNLEEIGTKLQGGLSPRVKALMEEML